MITVPIIIHARQRCNHADCNLETLKYIHTLLGCILNPWSWIGRSLRTNNPLRVFFSFFSVPSVKERPGYSSVQLHIKASSEASDALITNTKCGHFWKSFGIFVCGLVEIVLCSLAPHSGTSSSRTVGGICEESQTDQWNGLRELRSLLKFSVTSLIWKSLMNTKNCPVCWSCPFTVTAANFNPLHCFCSDRLVNGAQWTILAPPSLLLCLLQYPACTMAPLLPHLQMKTRSQTFNDICVYVCCYWYLS